MSARARLVLLGACALLGCARAEAPATFEPAPVLDAGAKHGSLPTLAPARNRDLGNADLTQLPQASCGAVFVPSPATASVLRLSIENGVRCTDVLPSPWRPRRLVAVPGGRVLAFDGEQAMACLHTATPDAECGASAIEPRCASVAPGLDAAAVNELAEQAFTALLYSRATNQVSLLRGDTKDIESWSLDVEERVVGVDALADGWLAVRSASRLTFVRPPGLESAGEQSGSEIETQPSDLDTGEADTVLARKDSGCLIAFSVEQARVRVASPMHPEPFELDPRDLPSEGDAGRDDSDPGLRAIARSHEALFLLGDDTLYELGLDAITCRPVSMVETSLDFEPTALAACGDAAVLWAHAEPMLWVYASGDDGLVGASHPLDQAVLDVTCVQKSVLVATLSADGERPTGYAVLALPGAPEIDDGLPVPVSLPGRGRVVGTPALSGANVFVASTTGSRHELNKLVLGTDGIAHDAKPLSLEREPVVLGALCGGCECDEGIKHSLFVAERQRSGRVTFVDDQLGSTPITDFDLAGIVRREGAVR